ncbi:MAG: hypothetical protein ACPGXZ_16415 [Saprospiraceae bacterium]
MKKLSIILLSLLIILASCRDEKPSSSVVSNDAAQDKAESPMVFNCVLNDMKFNADEAKATVFRTNEQIDSIVISASQAGVTMKSFVYIFEGVGNYPFKNNDQNQGIARGELLQTEDGKAKSFYSIDGAVYISYFNLEKKILSGTFESSYFYKGNEMPETFDATEGSFNNLPITIVVNE